jgi:hypothetical protein
VCYYEQVLRDILSIERANGDLPIRITEETIEEKLQHASAKHGLALAALDAESDVD